METKNNPRESFVFYRGHYDAIQVLSKKNQLIAYDAIAKYALYNELEMEKLPKQVVGLLRVMIPNIDAAIRNYDRRVRSKEKKMSKSNFEWEFDEEVQLPMKKDVTIADESSDKGDENVLYVD